MTPSQTLDIVAAMFGSLLRRAGVATSPAEVIEVRRVLGLLGARDLTVLRAALRATCAKFRRRWSFMEGAAWARGERLEDLSTDEQEELWQQAKAHEREVAEAREA